VLYLEEEDEGVAMSSVVFAPAAVGFGRRRYEHVMFALRRGDR